MSCRSSGGRAFHTLGPAAEKLLSPKLLWVHGMTQVLSLADCSRRCLLSATSWTSSARYWGTCPDSDLYIKQPSLKWIRWRTGSQCNSRRTGVMWSRRLSPDTCDNQGCIKCKVAPHGLATYLTVCTLSGWRCSCFEQSAAACHVCHITVCLPQLSEDTSLYSLFSLLAPAVVTAVCEKWHRHCPTH